MKFILDDEEFVDLEDVLKITGLKQANLYIKVRCKEFPAPQKKKVEIKFVRKRALWKKSEIEAYLEKCKVKK